MMASTAGASAQRDPDTVVNGSNDHKPAARMDSLSRERIAGSPLVPNGVLWAEDGRVAVVSEASIVISTFMSRELEMYIQQGPSVSKSFIFVPESAQVQKENVPLKLPIFSEPTDAHVPSGTLTYFLLHDTERHQYNPKELSLSKNDGTVFVSATWGPRGSGPNSSCAMLALTASSRVSLHFASGFHLSWKEAAVFSESLFEFMESHHWMLKSTASSAPSTPSKPQANGDGDTTPHAKIPTPKKGAKTPPSASGKKRKRAAPASDTVTMTMREYSRRCALVSTLSVAWSPFLTNMEQHTTSLIALCGRKIATVWGYDYPSYDAFTGGSASSGFLSSAPLVWLDTEKHGWVSCSSWQQMHRSPSSTHATISLVMGTSEGKILLANIPILPRDTAVAEAAIDRVILAPHAQPVFALRLGSRSSLSDSDLVAASGSRISVWNMSQKRPQPVSWKAHTGNVTSIDVDYFGSKIFSCGVDGKIKLWAKDTGEEIPLSLTGSAAVDAGNDALEAAPTTVNQSAARHPIFGLCVSPNSAQIACLHVIPPAARPNRKSQADVSYSRVSCALEFLATPDASHASTFVSTMCRVLESSRDTSTLTDVLWFCHEDNAAITSISNTADLTLPHLLNKLKGVSRQGDETRLPLYLCLCDELERRHFQGEASTPLLLQAAYLLRSCVSPADHHIAMRDQAVAKIKRALYAYWAEQCLKALLASHSQVQNFADISPTEKKSALLMADFLSVQQPTTDSSERLVTTIYNRLGADETIAQWSSYLRDRVEYAAKHSQGAAVAVPEPPVPPSRQACFICEEPVPFGELDQFCASGHAQDRCFLSFQVLSSMDAWKCMGCGASACEIDSSAGRSPFYLLDSHTAKRSTLVQTEPDTGRVRQIVCRMCGNFCSFLRY